jgi:hypothetical protein
MVCESFVPISPFGEETGVAHAWRLILQNLARVLDWIFIYYEDTQGFKLNLHLNHGRDRSYLGSLRMQGVA